MRKWLFLLAISFSLLSCEKKIGDTPTTKEEVQKIQKSAYEIEAESITSYMALDYKVETNMWGNQKIEFKVTNNSRLVIFKNFELTVDFINDNGQVTRSTTIRKNNDIKPGKELNFHEDIDFTGRIQCRIVNFETSPF